MQLADNDLSQVVLESGRVVHYKGLPFIIHTSILVLGSAENARSVGLQVFHPYTDSFPQPQAPAEEK